MISSLFLNPYLKLFLPNRSFRDIKTYDSLKLILSTKFVKQLTHSNR